MSRIFLSHSAVNNRQAIALKRWLSSQRPQLANEIFLDIDPDGLAAGRRWKAELYRENARCEVVICLLSRAWVDSHECRTEYRTAEALGKQILVARLEDLGTDDITAEWQHVDLFAEGSTVSIDIGDRQQIEFNALALEQIRKSIEGSGVGADNFVWPPASDLDRTPYRGWEPFEAVDAGVFFGRDAAIVQGMDELRKMRRSGTKSLFVILGPSGSGKSSFLRAGLVPRLQRDDHGFFVLDAVRPERDAIGGTQGFAVAVRRACVALGVPGVRLGELRRVCRSDTGRVAEVFAQLRAAAADRLPASEDEAAAPTIILPLDQAEELFSAESGEEAGAFLHLIAELTAAMNVTDVGFAVAATIRTDRYEEMQKHPALRDVTSVLFDELKPMPPHQFRDVVTGPARRSAESDQRVSLTPELVERLLEDATAGGGDALPLLSLTLSRLATEWGDEEGELCLTDYESMGGIADVVNNEVLQALSSDAIERKDQLDLLRQAFIPWLATINPSSDQATRRVAKWEELPSRTRPLIDALVARRLLVKDVREGQTTVEVALESLLRQWDELAGWIREERKNLAMVEDLQRNAEAWEASERDPAWLVGGSRLLDAEGLVAREGFGTRLERLRSYLDVSRVSEDGRIAAETAAAAAKRRRIVQAVGAIGVVVGLVASFLGWQWYSAFERNKGLDLLAQSEQILQGGQRGGDVRALQQLLVAGNLGSSSAAVVASALRDTLMIVENPPLSTSDEPNSVHSVAVSPDGARAAEAGRDQYVRIWDLASGHEAGTRDVGDGLDVRAVAYSTSAADRPDVLLAAGAGASAGSRGRLLVWGADSDEVVFDHWSDESVDAVAFNSDASLVAEAGHGRLRVWNVGTKQEVFDVKAVGPDGFSVRGVAFDPRRADRIVTAGDDGWIQMWDLRNPEPVATSRSGLVAVASVQIDPTGQCTVVGRLDGTIEVLDTETMTPVVGPVRAHSGTVQSVAYSAGGTRFVTGGSDNAVKVWAVPQDDPSIPGCQTAEPRPVGDPLLGHHGMVNSVTFNPTSTEILSGGSDGSVRVWDALTALPIPADQGDSVRAVAFNADGSLFASGGTDGTVKIWDTEFGSLQAQLGSSSIDFQGSINGLMFTPDGRRLVTVSRDGWLRLWRLPDMQGSQRKLTRPLVEKQVSDDNGNPRWFRSIAVSDELIVTGDMSGSVELWRTDTLDHLARGVARLDAPDADAGYQVWSVAFNPTGNMVASGSGFDRGGDRPRENNVVQLWKVDATGSDDTMLTPMDPPLTNRQGLNLYGVAFSPDGSRIATGSNDGSVTEWDVASKAPTGTSMAGDYNAVMAVAYARNHPWIAAGGADGKVRLWDAATHQPLELPRQSHETWIYAVAFSPNDEWLVSAGADGNLRLSHTPTDFASSVCAKIGDKNMTEKEWDAWVSSVIPYRTICPH